MHAINTHTQTCLSLPLSLSLHTHAPLEKYNQLTRALSVREWITRKN